MFSYYYVQSTPSPQPQSYLQQPIHKPPPSNYLFNVPFVIFYKNSTQCFSFLLKPLQYKMTPLV